MKKDLLVKTLALCVVVLFISVSFQPIIAENTKSVVKESDYCNEDFKEAKEYLFQTIIDISNNPDVKNLFEQLKYNQRLFTSDYDYKSVFSQLLFKKLRLLKSMLFTKPKMTYEYLETNYGRGLEIVDIIGEEESLKIAESVKNINPELFNELNNIIANDEELSNKISVLKKMNNDLKSNIHFEEYPIICALLAICIISLSIPLSIFMFLLYQGIITGNFHLLLLLIFGFMSLIFYGPSYLIVYLAYMLNCDWY